MGTSATLPTVETTRMQRITVTSLTRPLLFAATLLATTDIASATDWPQWRGIKRDGISYETGWLTNWPPKEVWRKTISTGNSSVTIDNGRLYTMGYTTMGANSNVIYCFNAADGTLLWTTTYQCGAGPGEYGGVKSTPVVAGNELYTFGQEGHLHCLNKTTGSILWNTVITLGQPYYGFAGSPVVDGDLVIVNASGAGVAVNRTHPHAVVWSNDIGEAGYSSPFVYTSTNLERIVVLNTGSGLYGVNATNGTIIWRYTWLGGAYKNEYGASDPVIVGNKLFVTDGWRKYYAKGGGTALINLGTGVLTHSWTNSNLLAFNGSSPIAQGNYIYGLHASTYTGNFKLRCLNATDGSIVWTGTNTVKEGEMIYADGMFVFLDKLGTLSIAQGTPTGYLCLKSGFNIGNDGDCYTYPVLFNGRLYCRSGTTLVCFLVGPDIEPDGDTDGMPDAWEQRHFTGAANCGPTDDSDSDGVSNRDEYLAGTDPTNSQSCATLTATSTGGKLVFTTPTVKAEGTGYMTRARFYTMESSTSLTGSAWSPFLDCMDVVGTNAPISYTNTPSGSQKFYRMKVTLE